MAPLCLKVKDWPQQDQVLWETAQQPAGFLEGSKPASLWSPKRRRIVEQAYGQWLSWLLRTGRLVPDSQPGERATRELVEAFTETLALRVAPQSVSMMIGGFKRMLDVLDPKTDRDWLTQLYSMIKRNAKPSRNRFAHAVSPEELYELGLRLMTESCDSKANHAYHPSTKCRDGMMIAILICCPVRIANLEQIEIGVHLLFEDGCYWLSFTAEEIKTNEPYQGDLPRELTPWIDQYLEVHRPILLSRGQKKPTRRLWIDRLGKPMLEHSIRDQINSRTREAFGRNVWPHLFRHCAVTGLVDYAPEDIAIAPDLLGHSSDQTTQKHYILARGTRAHRDVQENLARARKRARKRLKEKS